MKRIIQAAMNLWGKWVALQNPHPITRNQRRAHKRAQAKFRKMKGAKK